MWNYWATQSVPSGMLYLPWRWVGSGEEESQLIGICFGVFDVCLVLCAGTCGTRRSPINQLSCYLYLPRMEWILQLFSRLVKFLLILLFSLSCRGYSLSSLSCYSQGGRLICHWESAQPECYSWMLYGTRGFVTLLLRRIVLSIGSRGRGGCGGRRVKIR